MRWPKFLVGEGGMEGGEAGMEGGWEEGGEGGRVAMLVAISPWSSITVPHTSHLRDAASVLCVRACTRGQVGSVLQTFTGVADSPSSPPPLATVPCR